MKLEEWQKANKFMPLTYLEVMANKPLVIKIDDEFQFVSYPQSALTFATMMNVKDGALDAVVDWAKKRPRKEEKIKEKNENLLRAIGVLVEVLFQVSCEEYADDEKQAMRYRQALFDYAYRDVEWLIDMWSKFLEHNTRLEKKNNVPAELQSDTTTRGLDKWRGFLAGRPEIQTSTFIRMLHEDEHKTTEAIRQWRESKDRERRSGKNVRQ